MGKSTENVSRYGEHLLNVQFGSSRNTKVENIIYLKKNEFPTSS